MDNEEARWLRRVALSHGLDPERTVQAFKAWAALDRAAESLTEGFTALRAAWRGSAPVPVQSAGAQPPPANRKTASITVGKTP